jgi:dihydrofolate reductase
MTKVIAGITTSLDGYITGPNDGPGNGLGDGGERLHYWVFGGPWSYAEDPKGEATGVDKEYLNEGAARNGAVIAGRGTYEASDHWGGKNPWATPFFIVTHRPEEEPEGQGFTFVGSLGDAVSRAKAAAGTKDVAIMGGANTIRQGLRDGYVEQLTITTAPVILGGGKRLFEGFTESLELEPIEVRSSPLATHVTYRVIR